METLAINRGIVGATALPFQYLPSQHVNRTTYPDPQVFDRNGDGNFNVLDIVGYQPTWGQLSKNGERVIESAQPDEKRTAEGERKSAGLRAYERSAEVETEHAVEVAV